MTLVLLLMLISVIAPFAMTVASQRKPTGCLDRRQSAEFLSISTRKLDDIASSGAIPRVKIGSKTLFRVADLDAFVDSKVQRLGCTEGGEDDQ